MRTSLVQRFQESPFLAQILALAVVAIMAFTVNFYKLGAWPWDHDEVPSLMELGVLEVENAQGRLKKQLTLLPQIVPTWYNLQRLFLEVFPVDEFGTRVLSALCASLTVILVYLFAQLWRGTLFAIALTLLVGLNQCFVWLAQQNRFYSMGIFFLLLSLATMWTKTEKHSLFTLLCGVSTLLTVLSHSLLAVLFWIGGIAAAVCLPFRLIPKTTGLRALLAAAVAFLTYSLYLRPLTSGWISGDSGGTNELVSFAAQLGIPTIALAAAGMVWSLRTIFQTDGFAWWMLVLVGGMTFIGLSSVLMGNWNPRYALFFMVPFWVFAAYAVEQVAFRFDGHWHRVAWFLCIALLLMPKFMSHFRDGSRHDFRTAANRVAALSKGNEPIYSNWPFALGYYLKFHGLQQVEAWNRVVKNNRPSGIVVLASNAFAPIIEVPHTNSVMVDKIVTRRFDEQTHVIRIYRLTPEVVGNKM